jgi:hypothetical protein
VTWSCPRCERRFGRANQSHGCSPAGSVDWYFADRPPALRRIHDVVVRHLRKLGPLTVEAVRVGILIKRNRTFAELRPGRTGFRLSVLLPELVDDPRITRVIRTSAHRVAHFIPLRTAADVDRDVRRWLTEAYLSSPV